MTTLANEEASEELFDNENMGEADQEESSSPRKRGSPLKSSTKNPRRKKSKRAANTNKEEPLDGVIENTAAEDKENNGRRPSPHSPHLNKSTDVEGGNDFFKNRNINQKNKPPEAGVITKIYAENFMW